MKYIITYKIDGLIWISVLKLVIYNKRQKNERRKESTAAEYSARPIQYVYKIEIYVILYYTAGLKEYSNKGSQNA